MNIRNYCDEKGISLTDFSKATGISLSHVYLFSGNSKYNVTRENMRKIYLGTLKEFGVGLLPHEYLDITK